MKYKLFALVALLFFTSACTSLSQLNSMNKNASTVFNQELAMLYKKHSQNEAKRYDWDSSAYFAKKGISALNDENVQAGTADEWNIDPNDSIDLDWARARLTKALTPAVKQDFGTNAARTQFFYDCWQEEQAEAWRTQELDACRSDFLVEMGLLEQKIAPIVPIKVEKTEEPEVTFIEEVEEPAIPEFAMIEDYNAFFAFGSYNIAPKTESLIIEAANKAKNLKFYTINVDGHADTMGNADFNLKLSEKRALSVTESLINKGIDPKFIETNWYGETKPKIKTGDGVAKKLNRRVEIIIKGSQ